MAKWRIEGQERKGSVYWSLRSGRGSERRALSLGCVSEEAARRAVDTISADEEAGRLEQVVEWHREDRDRAIRYLCGDPVAARLLAERPDFRRMPLRAYYDEVYAAWRAENATGGWRQEKGIWSRILEDLGDVRLEGIDAHRVADYLDALIVKAGPREGKPASGNAKRLHRAAISLASTGRHAPKAWKQPELERAASLTTREIPWWRSTDEPREPRSVRRFKPS